MELLEKKIIDIYFIFLVEALTQRTFLAFFDIETTGGHRVCVVNTHRKKKIHIFYKRFLLLIGSPVIRAPSISPLTPAGHIPSRFHSVLVPSICPSCSSSSSSSLPPFSLFLLLSLVLPTFILSSCIPRFCVRCPLGILAMLVGVGWWGSRPAGVGVRGV